jgi:ubiquinone/menaquinone biosynthesis C-methylase UbiE
MEKIEYQTMAAVEEQHWWYGGMRAIAAALIDTVFADRHNLTILDAGCGTGANLLWLRRYGHVVGIDMSPDAIELGRTRFQGSAVRGSVLQLPLADHQFDLVTSFEVIYHNWVPDEVLALREFARVLRPGGHVVLRLPAFEFLRGKHDRSVFTRKRFTIRETDHALQRAGFRLVHATYVNMFLLPIAMVQRVVERTFDTGSKDSDLVQPSAPINELLRWPLAAEAAWVGRGGAFPVGLSLLCMAKYDG